MHVYVHGNTLIKISLVSRRVRALTKFPLRAAMIGAAAESTFRVTSQTSLAAKVAVIKEAASSFNMIVNGRYLAPAKYCFSSAKYCFQVRDTIETLSRQ